MTELSVARAVEVLDRATGFEEPLRTRTEGTTWMVWGLATAGLFLGAEAIRQALGAPWEILLGIPIFLGGGYAITSSLWATAALTAPAVRPSQTRAGVAALFTAAVAMAGMLLLSALLPRWGFFYMPAVVGVAWFTLGALNIRGTSALGRKVMMAIGAAIVVLGIAYGATAPLVYNPRSLNPFPLDPEDAVGLIGGLVPVLGGLWQARRG